MDTAIANRLFSSRPAVPLEMRRVADKAAVSVRIRCRCVASAVISPAGMTFPWLQVLILVHFFLDRRQSHRERAAEVAIVMLVYEAMRAVRSISLLARMDGQIVG